MDISGGQDAVRLRELLLSGERKTKNGEIIGTLFDSGTFAEIGTFLKNGETVSTGYGAVNERLVYAFIEDGDSEKGAFGAGQSDKICSLLSLAAKNEAPVIGVFDSSGAKITEGTAALSGYGRVIGSLCDIKNTVPKIAVINGICSGAAAVTARFFDIVITVKDKAKLFVVPPFLTGGKNINPAASGLIDIEAENIEKALNCAKELLDFFPSSNRRQIPRAEVSDDPDRLATGLEAALAGSYNASDIIKIIADDGKFIEAGNAFARQIITGFIYLGGIPAGVVANNPACDGGALTPAAASKASRLIGICGRYGLPLLTFVDTPGYDYTLASEEARYAEALALLGEAYAVADCPRVTVILGGAYGSAFTLMGSKALGSDIAYALTRADISIMNPDSAIQFLYGDKIKTSPEPEKTRAELLAEYKANESSPLSAAREGVIDDIIEYKELRQRVISAFEMLSFGT